jgi:hypothetical protein
MHHPILACDGRVYERDAIVNWIRQSKLSPISQYIILAQIIVTAVLIRDLIAWKARSPRIRIFIKFRSRLLMRINAELTMQVIDIKWKIAKSTGIPLSDQILTYGGVILNSDSYPIDALQLKSGSEIHISRRCFVQQLSTIPEE